MKAGNLNSVVDLLRRPAGTDSLGQPPREFDRFATVWAEVKPTTAKEARAAQQVANVMDLSVTIRWFDGVLPIDRVRLPDGRVANVTSVVDVRLGTRDDRIALLLHRGAGS